MTKGIEATISKAWLEGQEPTPMACAYNHTNPTDHIISYNRFVHCMETTLTKTSSIKMKTLTNEPTKCVIYGFVKRAMIASKSKKDDFNKIESKRLF